MIAHGPSSGRSLSFLRLTNTTNLRRLSLAAASGFFWHAVLWLGFTELGCSMRPCGLGLLALMPSPSQSGPEFLKNSCSLMGKSTDRMSLQAAWPTKEYTMPACLCFLVPFLVNTFASALGEERNTRTHTHTHESCFVSHCLPSVCFLGGRANHTCHPALGLKRDSWMARVYSGHKATDEAKKPRTRRRGASGGPSQREAAGVFGLLQGILCFPVLVVLTDFELVLSDFPLGAGTAA